MNGASFGQLCQANHLLILTMKIKTTIMMVLMIILMVSPDITSRHIQKNLLLLLDHFTHLIKLTIITLIIDMISNS